MVCAYFASLTPQRGKPQKMSARTCCAAAFAVFTLLTCFSFVFTADEACYSYAGGQVFPQETRRTSGHTIQWSQAVSKWTYRASWCWSIIIQPVLCIKRQCNQIFYRGCRKADSAVEVAFYSSEPENKLSLNLSQLQLNLNLRWDSYILLHAN